MGVDLEIVIALVTTATAAGAAVATRVAPRPSRPPPPPPAPVLCSPEVTAQVDELHGLLARRDPITGGSVVLTHLSELPRIRELLEVIAKSGPAAAGAAE